MIELENLPEEIRSHVKQDIEKHGEWATSWMLSAAPLWRMADDLQPADTDTVWAAVALHMISFFSTKDPSLFHFRIARDYLQKKFEKEPDDKAVDLLARQLVKSCGELLQYIQKSSGIGGESALYLFGASVDEKGFVLPPRDFQPGVIYEQEERNLLDFLFSEYIKSVGAVGREAAEKVLKYSKEHHGKYRESSYSPSCRPESWGLWINKFPGTQTTIWSKFLDVILVEVIWEDLCAEKWGKECRRSDKNVPALTHGVHPSVTRILSPKTQSQVVDNKVQMLHSGKIIASIPTIDQKLMSIVTKGAGNLNSIYHHKLIRHECRSGFENWVQDKEDPRVLRFEKGCTEIAEKLGLTSNRAVEEIKALLHAQAFMHFNFEDGSSGNLISLRNFRSRGCNRDDGVEIVLGTQLLPHYTFQAPRKERLLIPVPELPPFVSAPQYHSGQALLQMMVMEEFTENSIEFVDCESIKISDQKWEEFAKETGLPASVFKQALDRWVRDGDDGPRFLVQIEKDRYALGDNFKKEAEFLRCQGALRKSRKKEGEKSALLRKRKQDRKS